MHHRILSICIPTYNRLWKLRQQIEALLSVNDTRFDIIISDNDSTDGTKEYLKELSNKGNVITLHQLSVPSAENVASALLGADGDFALLLLDKDSMDPSGLPVFLDILGSSDVKTGYCRLDMKQPEGSAVIINKAGAGFSELAYSCRHPSGYFFHNEEMRQIFYDIKGLVSIQFPFVWDVVFTHLAAQYATMVYACPFMFSETDQEGTVVKSLTYTKDNLWFAPKQVVNRYLIFLSDAVSLPLAHKTKKRMEKLLIHRCFRTATLGYAGFLTNQDICIHYGIRYTKLTQKELLQHSKYVFSALGENGYKGLWLLIAYLINRLSIITFAYKNRT